MAETEQPPLKTYRANCHCGLFVFEAELPEIKTGYQCNCSICAKKSYVWTFPAPGAYKIVKGDEKDLVTYAFNEGKLEHKFCPKCGTALMGRSKNKPPGRDHALNIRAFQGPIDLQAIEQLPFDGRSLQPAYAPPAYDGPVPTGDGAKVYHGSCHCGAVTLALKFKDLDALGKDDRVAECNCSACQRAGAIWIYPSADQVVIQGRDQLTYYVMGFGIARKSFCKTCGVHIANEDNHLTDEQVAALPEPTRAWLASSGPNWVALNIRTLNDYDATKLKTHKFEGYNFIQPLYVNP